MRLLLVEDDETAALAVGWALKDAGFEVEIVDVGRRAVGAIAFVRPDAVILDISLRDIDGVTLTKYIRELWPTLPIVLASGHSDFHGLADVLSHPKTAYLQKPYDIATLIAIIEKLASG